MYGNSDKELGFESVFDKSIEAEDEFETMFGAEEDNRLMEAVLDEDGTDLPDEDELHQTDDNATVDDLEDELGEGHDTDNAPKVDSADDEDIIDTASGGGIDIAACDKVGIEGQVKGKEPNPEDIEGSSEKDTKNLVDALEEDGEGAEEEPTDDGEDDNDDDSEGDVGGALVDELEDDIEEGADTDDIPDEGEEGDPGDTVDEAAGDSSLVDELEDEIIDKVENEKDPTISDKELKGLEAVDDSDIIDMVEGQK